MKFTLTVNGEAREVRGEARYTLADVLGTHAGCEHGICGACTVIVDGEPLRACLMFAIQAAGSEVTTIEGITGSDGGLNNVQEAFRAEHRLQCGFCTPGFVVSVTAFLRDFPNPTDRQIKEALSGNLCRCTGYQHIVEAVEYAAKKAVAGKP